MKAKEKSKNELISKCFNISQTLQARSGFPVDGSEKIMFDLPQ